MYPLYEIENSSALPRLQAHAPVIAVRAVWCVSMSCAGAPLKTRMLRSIIKRVQRDQRERRHALPPTLQHTPPLSCERATLKPPPVQWMSVVQCRQLDAGMQLCLPHASNARERCSHAVRGHERGLRGAYAHFLAKAYALPCELPIWRCNTSPAPYVYVHVHEPRVHGV